MNSLTAPSIDRSDTGTLSRAPLRPRTATVNQGKPHVIVTIGMPSRGRHSKGPPSVRGLTQHSWRGTREKLMTFTKKHVKKYVKN